MFMFFNLQRFNCRFIQEFRPFISYIIINEFLLLVILISIFDVPRRPLLFLIFIKLLDPFNLTQFVKHPKPLEREYTWPWALPRFLSGRREFGWFCQLWSQSSALLGSVPLNPPHWFAPSPEINSLFLVYVKPLRPETHFLVPLNIRASGACQC